MEVRIAVPPDLAEQAMRIIAEHREQVTGGVVVPLERAIAGRSSGGSATASATPACSSTR